jgi:hypothetical protein
MSRPLIVALLLISAAPVYAQGQQPDAAKLKTDAQKVVSIIKGDMDKIQVYCEISDLGEQIGEADQKKDDQKAEALSQQAADSAPARTGIHLPLEILAKLRIQGVE